MVSFEECIGKSISTFSGLYFSILDQQKFKTIIINEKQNNQKLKILKDKYNNPWSSSKVEDELVLHLSSYAEEEISVDNEILIRHPYQEEAEFMLYRINLVKPIPNFIIYECLLPTKLRQELIDLAKYDQYEFNRIVTNALKRLYESIDYEYFHTSGIGGKTNWRILS